MKFGRISLLTIALLGLLMNISLSFVLKGNLNLAIRKSPVYLSSTAQISTSASPAATNSQGSSKKDIIKATGIVLESLPNAMFRVELDESKKSIIAMASGKIRSNHIKIIVGDQVEVEISTYDVNKGRIIFRRK